MSAGSARSGALPRAVPPLVLATSSARASSRLVMIT
jgi:hypothetical protein